MALSDILMEQLNRSPASVFIEQMRKLYMRTYPYVAQDFVHRGDLAIILKEIDAKLIALSAAIATHPHVVAGQATLPSGIAVPTPATVQSIAVAESLILAAGLPQPTGEGPPAILPSRVGTPLDIIAIPPLSPTDFTV